MQAGWEQGSRAGASPAIENLLTDATQQSLEFYDSRLSAQVATVTPVVSPVVLLGEPACRAAFTAPSPAACSNELLEIPYGLDAHTVEVDDAVSRHLDSEYVYFECRFVLSSSLYIYFQNSTSMVNEGLWIGLEVANTTPASHRQSAPRAINYLHRIFDVIPEVYATSALCEFSRMRREGQLHNSHEAFVNEVAMCAELRRARRRWDADKHGLLRWRQWARRYSNAPFSAELGSHNAPPGARGTHYTFPAGSDNVCLALPPGATRPSVPAASSIVAHCLPHATQVATHDPPCSSRTSL